jgi:hypothetical protein
MLPDHQPTERHHQKGRQRYAPARTPRDDTTASHETARGCARRPKARTWRPNPGLQKNTNYIVKTIAYIWRWKQSAANPSLRIFPVKQGKNRENSRFRPISALLDPAISLKNNRFFLKFPKQQNREFFQRNRELNPQNRELFGGSGNRRMGPPQLRIRGPHPPLFKKMRISAAD